MGHSALVIIVAEAEPVVGEQRRLHDPVAALGVPAHITILFPFRPEIDGSTAAQIRSLAASIEPFDIEFRATRRFPEDVIYLAPEPDGPLRRLIEATTREFPDCPPYGGEIADPTPHLTIGMSSDVGTLDHIASEVAPRLPFGTSVERLTLLETDDEGRWTSSRHWMLGSGIDA